MKSILSIISLLFFFLPITISAQTLNAGFVQGVWYSKSPFFAGETIRIYTAVQNNSGFDITGTIEFVMNGTAIGETGFSAIDGRIVEVWKDWEVTKGDHAIGASIKEAFKVEIGKEPEGISLEGGTLGASQVFADQDTDQDGISDAVEIDEHTNPLTPTKIVEETTSKEPKESVIAEVTNKVTQEYLPAVVTTVDSLVEATTEKLQERRQEIKARKESFATSEDSASSSIIDQGLDLLLAGAIVALPQWQLGLFLFFAIAAALMLRRLMKPEQQV